jgi:hypothetical protein
MTASARIDDPMRHSFTLRAIPLDELSEEALNDLSWLLRDDSIRTCYTSLMIVPPVLLVFKDTLSEPVLPSEVPTSSPTH